MARKHVCINGFTKGEIKKALRKAMTTHSMLNSGELEKELVKIARKKAKKTIKYIEDRYINFLDDYENDDGVTIKSYDLTEEGKDFIYGGTEYDY